MTSRFLALVVVAAVVAASGCGSGGSGSTQIDGSSEPAGALLVFAAASLTDVFGEIEEAFEQAEPGVSLSVNLGGSSSLREQILEGAPADVFASADEANMTPVVDAGAVDATPTIFATNRLQIVVPAGNPGGVESAADLADPDLLIGLCDEAVPCGALARQALDSAGVQPSLDTNEPDVRSLLTKVMQGELDAGIVYATDVIAGGDDVMGIDFIAADDVLARYPLAVLSDSSNPVAAAAFRAFVLSAEGQDILERHGFGPP